LLTEESTWSGSVEETRVLEQESFCFGHCLALAGDAKEL